MRGRGRGGGGRGGAKRPFEDGTLDPEEEKRIQKRGPVNTRATYRQSVQESPTILPALQQQAPVVIMHRPDPIDANLLSGFGGFNQGELDTLETFFAWCENFGNEHLKHGMLKLSLSMRSAIDQHTKVFNDLRIMNGRVDALTMANTGAERIMDSLRKDNTALKVVVIFFEFYVMCSSGLFPGESRQSGDRDVGHSVFFERKRVGEKSIVQRVREGADRGVGHPRVGEKSIVQRVGEGAVQFFCEH